VSDMPDRCCPSAAACPSATPFSLNRAVARFEREAEHGVCDTGRYRCAYYAWGTGPPLVFVHGMGDRARAYVPVISLLAPFFRCIAYELPAGHGDGAALGRYRHADLVADLFALLDHLGTPRSYIFATSFGATITLAALHARPQRLPRAVLAAGFARRPLAPLECLLAGLVSRLPVSIGALPLDRARGRRALGPHARRRPDLFAYYLRTAGTATLDVHAWCARMIHRTDLRPLLPEVRQPVLLLVGDCDRIVRRACEEELLEGLPCADRIEIGECGHCAHYTHPEVVAELVRRFLTPPEARDGPTPRA
jgi:pimeloyl-ACP methyl ester carboxylesterase